MAVLERIESVLLTGRPDFVDNPVRLETLVRTLGEVAERLPLVWPVHVRTQECLRAREQFRELIERPGFVCFDALSYREFVALMGEARLVLTDSGGVQEETTVLGVAVSPCASPRSGW